MFAVDGVCKREGGQEEGGESGTENEELGLEDSTACPVEVSEISATVKTVA